MAKLYLNRINEYDFEKIVNIVRNIILDATLSIKNKVILVKPNLLNVAEPEKAVTTHPIFLKAVLRVLKEFKPAIIRVGDSPAIVNATKVAESCGILQATEEEDAEFVNLADPVEVKNKNYILLPNLTLSKTAIEADLIINLPKMKTHSFMTMTGAVKNLFGTVCGLQKGKMHFRFSTPELFSKMLLDVYKYYKENNSLFSIMDAILAMEGDGPGNGDPILVGGIFASEDALLIDALVAIIMGFTPDKIFTNRFGSEYKIGSINLKEANIIGADYRSFIVPEYRAVSPISPLRQKIYSMLPEMTKYILKVPKVKHSHCKACLECVKVCPAEPKAVFWDKGKKKIKFNYDRCIKCYCCHEVCKYDAIRLKRIFIPQL